MTKAHFPQKTTANSGSFWLVSTIGIIIWASSPLMAAASSTVAVSGSAATINGGNTVNFDASPFNGNVTINSTTGAFDGSAWSAELGWIAFGSNDNPDGPVSVSLTSGQVSGEAYVINSGNIVNFNASPFNSDVTVNLKTGVFSGDAWSPEIGWIDFAGVSTGGTALVSAATSSSSSSSSVTKQVSATVTETPAPAAAAAPTLYRLVIKLVDANGRALIGVTATLHSQVQTAISDKNGQVVFTGVAAGTHTLTLTDGRYSGQQTIVVSAAHAGADHTQTVSITLHAPPTNWWLIGLVAALVFLLGLAIGIVWRRRARRLTH